jgi:hypothetical protein
MEDVCIFYDIWSNFMAIWYILCPCGIFRSNLEYFPRFCIMYQEKSGNHYIHILKIGPKFSEVCRFRDRGRQCCHRARRFVQGGSVSPFLQVMPTSVTRLGDHSPMSPIGRLFGQFFNNCRSCPIFCYFFLVYM